MANWFTGLFKSSSDDNASVAFQQEFQRKKEYGDKLKRFVLAAISDNKTYNLHEGKPAANLGVMQPIFEVRDDMIYGVIIHVKDTTATGPAAVAQVKLDFEKNTISVLYSPYQPEAVNTLDSFDSVLNSLVTYIKTWKMYEN